MDDIDRSLLRALQEDARISIQELGRSIGLSRAATHARVRRLERDGVIRRYAAILDPATAGFDLVCFIHVAAQIHTHEIVARTREALASLDEVLECHHVTGEYDYLLKVVLRNRRDLERFIVDRLTPVPGIQRINTSLVLAEAKSTTALPLGGSGES
jgi:DNA-binding Lrp family transcriptional regulator